MLVKSPVLLWRLYLINFYLFQRGNIHACVINCKGDETLEWVKNKVMNATPSDKPIAAAWRVILPD